VIDLELLLRFGFALAIVLALLAAIAWIARRRLGANGGSFARKARRLSISDATMLDSRTRLVLVRRDDVEHLIAIGGNGVTLLEAGIRPVPPAP
jgi:flagellar protein FliO/FliZ